MMFKRVVVFLFFYFSLSLFASFHKDFFIEYTGEDMALLETSEDISTDSITYVLRRGEELHRVVMNRHYETLDWYYMNYENDTEIRGHRNKNEIILTGTRGEDAIQKTCIVNFEPWFQAMEPSIHHFVSSTKKEQSFWVIDPESLQVYRMTAGGKDVVSVKTEDAIVETFQVTVTFASSMSVMWRANYWYRADDFSFFNYEAIADSPSVLPVRIMPYSGAMAK